MAKPKTKSRTSFSRAGIGFGVFVQAACVLFLVLAANYVGFNNFRRWDFSRSQRFTLADQTKQVLRQFDQPLKVVVYASPTSLGPESLLNSDLNNLLAELQFSAREKMQVEWVDPTRDQGRALDLQSKYKFDGRDSVLILDYEGRTKFVPLMDLGDFDMSGLQSGEPVRLEAFKGESVLTAAFIALQNPEPARIYFLQGHGESTAANLTRFTDALSRQNAEAWGLNLATRDSVPADAGAVCIFGAHYDISDRELAILQRYWTQNGRLVVLIDPNADPDAKVRMPNLRQLLKGVGIYPRNDRVQRLMQNPLNPGLVGVVRDIVIGTFLPDTPITKRLVGVNAYFVGGALSLYLDQAGATRSDIQLRPLIQAAEDYWGETHYTETEKEGVVYNENEDTGQPVILAASADKGGARDDRTDVATSRLVAVGSCKFIEDQAMGDTATEGNLDFMLSVINRMLDGRSKLTGMVPRPTVNYMLNLTDTQLRGIALYTLVIIPCAAALLGVIMGIRRRA
jgi:hypothetical protein